MHDSFRIRAARRRRARHRGERDADPDRRAAAGRDGDLLGGRRRVKVKLWGTRGSVPSPGPETTRYGGNTSCVQVTLSDGTILVARRRHRASAAWGSRWPTRAPAINILLTHLHLDHIQGLVFFAPAFRPTSEIVIWGPDGARGVARGPHRPLHLRAALAGRGARAAVRRVVPRRARRPSGRSARPRMRAASVTHRGPTLGYRITEGDTSLCYIPDHEPALGADLAETDAATGSRASSSPAAPTCSSTTASTRTTSTPTTSAGATRGSADALAFARRVERRAHCCSSTTTRSTRTTSSTRYFGRRSRRGPSSAATRRDRDGQRAARARAWRAGRAVRRADRYRLAAGPGVMKATAGPRPASRRSVAIRRPG